MIKTIFLDNIRDCTASLGELVRDFKKSSLIILVISFSLAVPSLLLLLASNFINVSKKLEHNPQITMFLQQNTNQFVINNLKKSLQKEPHITKITYMSKTQALHEFTKNLKLDLPEDLLENPLPAILVVHLNAKTNHKDANNLLQKLKKLPMVTMAQLDLDWLQKLNAIVDFFYTAAIILLIILIITTVTIIANTIHLKIDSQQQTIKILQLLGASKSFIQRPFIYQGFWYGAIGGLISVVLVASTIMILNNYIIDITVLYHSNFVLTNLGVSKGIFSTILGGLLGSIGAMFPVWQYCRS